MPSAASTADTELGFQPAKTDQLAEPDVGFVPRGTIAETAADKQADEARYGTIRSPTFAEKTAQIWNQATHGLFSAGPKASPAHVDGVQDDWKDLPHIWGGMAAEMLLSPGNILSGIFAGGLPAAGQKVVSKAFGAYMLANTAKSAPGLAREAVNPEITGAQKTADIGAAAGQAVLGAVALRGPRMPYVQTGVSELGNALRTMKPEDAGALLAKLHGASPLEASQLLSREVATADPAASEHLTSAAAQFKHLSDIEPPEVKQLNEAQKAWDEVQRVFAPASRGPNAEIAAGSLREMGGELAQRTDRATAALEASSKALMKMNPDARWEAVDRIEKGLPQTNPELQQFADTTRQIFDTKRDEIKGLGTGKLEHYIDDYFVHLWKDPEEAVTAFRSAAAKAPLEGTKGFLKQRTIPTIAEGRALGLEPVSDNPVDLVLLGARQMDKYIVGQKWMEEMKDRNLAQFVPAGEQPPEGYEPINDKIATVYGPRTGAVSFGPDVNTLTVRPEDVTVRGQRIMGKYYASSEVATVANNYLSPGLRQYASFRAYMTLANSLNRFQLGLSAFHLGFTSIDTSISKLALALEYGAQGKMLEAGKQASKIPVAPVTNLLQGSKVVSEWMKPGSQGAEFAKVADAIRMAGGRVKMDTIYQTTITKNMMDAWREGKKLGAIWRAPFAALEQVSKPLMEYIVPRQKLGVAADLMRMEMDRMPANATPDQMRKAYGKVWDSVDNRMGQMVYDNLFWNKAIKDLGMASVRSVGWDLGTIRELGGGVVDTSRFIKEGLGQGAENARAIKGDMTPKEAEFTHRMAYMIALPVLTGIIGATYQYLRTGKGPEELRDYFFPRTGEKDPQGRFVRMTLPTYMKDVYHYAHDPVQTVEGKVSPFPSLVYQMLNNKDYFGRDIRNSDDPLVKQMLSELKFAADAGKPLGIRQFEISEAAGQTTAEKAENFVGITRAPAWVGESTAEQLAGKLAGDKFKSATAPDTALVAKKQKIQVELRTGTDEQKMSARQELSDMEQSGQMTGVQVRNLLKGTTHDYLENAVSHLDAKEVMRVYSVAKPEEREAIQEQVRMKIMRAHLPSEDKKALLDRFEQLSNTERDINTSYR